MLLANVTVAEAILRAFPSCSLLRRHPTPTERQFDPLLRAAAATGASIEVSSSKVSFLTCCRRRDPGFDVHGQLTDGSYHDMHRGTKVRSSERQLDPCCELLLPQEP